ncbi:MAG: flagellar hook-associated protein FlgK [Phycisphaerae bacterium]|nr:flagellar hook-associated protein FlgK [Phycisphaerae bacterium]
MAGYEIGISGLHAAQLALDVVGNNLANGATEGYHRQTIDLRPVEDVYTGGHQIGQGVSVAGIQRMIDKLLDGEIVSHESDLAQIQKELEALTTMESAFAELTTSALSSAMDDFFDSMHQLAATPTDVNLQSLVVSGAETLANQLRNLSSVARDLEERTYTEARDTISDVNILTAQIADLNDRIASLGVRGKETNNLQDQRDQLITKLSQMIGIKTYRREYDVMDVVVGDTTVVLGSNVTKLDVGLVENGGDYDLGVTPAGQSSYNTRVEGGRIGGLISLRNSIIRDISDSLDTLAEKIIQETNNLHVQGVGSSGSFQRLYGWTMTESDVDQFIPPVRDGQIVIRLTSPTGAVTRHTITVDADTSTLSSVAADIAAIPGLNLNTGVNAGRLQIVANPGYSFDFLPGAMALPSGYPSGPLAGAGGGADEAPPTIEILGTYTGNTNQTYTCTVQTTPPGGTLAIGNGTMELEVVDGSGVIVAKINLGSGYTAGVIVGINEGLKIKLTGDGAGPGYLNDGEVFEIEALANSDTSGFLSATGINTFFSGVDASSIAVAEDIKTSGTRIAVSRSVAMTDSANVLSMAQIGDTEYSDLSNLSPKSFYRNLATDVGNRIAVTKTLQENTSGVWRNLSEQRSQISGVDMNDEAAKMLLYERMFQAMARYMNTVSKTLDEVLSLS